MLGCDCYEKLELEPQSHRDHLFMGSVLCYTLVFHRNSPSWDAPPQVKTNLYDTFMPSLVLFCGFGDIGCLFGPGIGCGWPSFLPCLLGTSVCSVSDWAPLPAWLKELVLTSHLIEECWLWRKKLFEVIRDLHVLENYMSRSEPVKTVSRTKQNNTDWRDSCANSTAARAEDLGLLPGTPVGQLTAACHYSSRRRACTHTLNNNEDYPKLHFFFFIKLQLQYEL